MTNENPNERVNPRLRDKIAAAKAGKSLRVVVPGKCKVCRNRSADVPMTKTEAMNWFANRTVPTTLPKYAQRMLETGVHRNCQKVLDAKAAAKKVARGGAVRAVPADPQVMARVRGRKVA